jgi:hypothetical protein
MLHRSFALTTAFFSLFAPSLAQSIDYAASGFVTGNTYRLLPYESQVMYSQGVIDGLLAAGLYGADRPELMTLIKCTEGMNGQQVAAILNNYLVQHPERWQLSMNWIAYRSMQDACNSK